MAKSITQKDISGCAIACTAYILKINYDRAKNLFENGSEKAPFGGFLCRDILIALKKGGRNYVLKYLKLGIKNSNCPDNSIVFIKKNDRYPIGHYLCRTNSSWMDPWTNFPQLPPKSGFRKRLPGKAKYLIKPVDEK